MGENLNLMQGLYITVSSMTIVFLILLLISGVLSVFKSIFKSETVVKTTNINQGKNDIEKDNTEVEEEKIIVALIASIKAGEGIANPNLHIKKITRIS